MFADHQFTGKRPQIIFIIAVILGCLDIGLSKFYPMARPLGPTLFLLWLWSSNWVLPCDMGFCYTPSGGWKHWMQISIGLGAVLFVLTWVQVQYSDSDPFLKPRIAWHHIVVPSLLAPIAEEILYRSIIAWATSLVWGKWAGICLSALMFAILHLVCGNLSWQNTLAGVILAWGFLESQCLLIPILWHIGGNLGVLWLMYG